MAPVASKHARRLTNGTLDSRRPSSGARDLVFFVATRKVVPAIEGLLDALRASADSLATSAASAAKSAADSGTETLREASALLHHASTLVESAIGGVCDGCTSALLRACLGCAMDSEGQPLHTKMPLVFVLWLLQLLYCAFVFTYMPAAGIAFNSPTSMIFHAFICLTLASFFQAARKDPGAVPPSAAWRMKGRPPLMLTETKRGTDEARWCSHQGCYKPDRSHHCRALGRVVLRMDHHCPWIGNTVGFGNHKFFFLFLLYATSACGFFGLNVLQLLVHATLPGLTSFLLIGAESLATLLGAILGPFFLFHCWLLCKNMTTVEFMEGRRDASAAAEEADSGSKAKADTPFPYDLGMYENLRSVLGENPLHWLLPVGGPPGDGLSFPRNGQVAPVRGAGSLKDARRPMVVRPWGGVQVKPAAPLADGTPSEALLPGASAAGAGSGAAVAALGGGSAVAAHGSKALGSEKGEGGTAGGESTAAEDDVEIGEEEWWEDSEEERGEEELIILAEKDQFVQGGASISSWLSPTEFVEDFGFGLGAIGEALSQAAGEAASRLSALCAVTEGREETKARRASWSRQAVKASEAFAAAERAKSPQRQGTTKELWIHGFGESV